MADTERKTAKVSLSPKEMLSAALNSGPGKKRPSAFPTIDEHQEAREPEEKAKIVPKAFKKLRTGKGWSSSDEDAQEAAMGFKKVGKQEGSAQETMKILKHRMRQNPPQGSYADEGAADQDSREAKEKERERGGGEGTKGKDSSKKKDEAAAPTGKKQPPKKTPSRPGPKKSASRSEASQQEPREPPPTWWKNPGGGGGGGGGGDPTEGFNKPFPQSLASAAAMAAAGGGGGGNGGSPGGDSRHAAIAHAAHAANADASRAAHVMKALQQRQVCWQGRVKHKMDNSLVELFHLAAAIPAELAEQFPPALYVSELRHRSEVVLSKHTWARCAAKTLTEKQAGKLQLLSDNKLVAIVRLQHCELILVPDLDQSTGAIRMAGFLLSNPIY